MLDREKKNLIAEREKMKESIRKLRARKGKVDIKEKQCKNCARDYIETENFNWSCRIHQGEWSGEIWWCCGKSNKDQPGCKYSKHESKEEDEEESIEDESAPQRTITNVRCLCCKELGHSMEQCPRDPNLRSQVDLKEDYARIQKIKDYRKLNADTVVTTTHFLKKCVLVPARMSDEEQGIIQHNPFKRGAMQFDDFNYDLHNPYILVREEVNKRSQNYFNQMRSTADLLSGQPISGGANKKSDFS